MLELLYICAHSDSIAPQIIVRNESKLEGNSKGKDEAKKT